MRAKTILRYKRAGYAFIIALALLQLGEMMSGRLTEDGHILSGILYTFAVLMFAIMVLILQWPLLDRLLRTRSK